MGRFLLYSTKTKDDSGLWRKNVEIDCRGAWRCPRNSLWFAVVTAALFFSAICLDMASDNMDNKAVAFVFPAIIISFTLVLFLSVRFKVLTIDKLESFSAMCDVIFRIIHGDLASNRVRKERYSEADGIMLQERIRGIDEFSIASHRGRDSVDLQEKKSHDNDNRYNVHVDTDGAGDHDNTTASNPMYPPLPSHSSS